MRSACNKLFPMNRMTVGLPYYVQWREYIALNTYLAVHTGYISKEDECVTALSIMIHVEIGFIVL